MNWQLGSGRNVGKWSLNSLTFVVTQHVHLSIAVFEESSCLVGSHWYLQVRMALGILHYQLESLSFPEVDYSTCGFSWLFAFPSRILKTRLRIFSCSFEFSSACWFSYLFSASGFYSDAAGALTLLAKMMKIFCRFQASALLPRD